MQPEATPLPGAVLKSSRRPLEAPPLTWDQEARWPHLQQFPSPYPDHVHKLRLRFNPRPRLHQSKLLVVGATGSFLSWRYCTHTTRKKATLPARSFRVASYTLLKCMAAVPRTLTHTSCFLSSWMALAFARDWEMQTVRTRLKADRTPGQSPLRPQPSGLTSLPLPKSLSLRQGLVM